MKDDEADVGRRIRKLAQDVVENCEGTVLQIWKDTLYTDEQAVIEAVSDPLLKPVAAVSPKMNQTLSAFLTGTVITKLIRNQAPALEVALGVLLRDSKAKVCQCMTVEFLKLWCTPPFQKVCYSGCDCWSLPVKYIRCKARLIFRWY